MKNIILLALLFASPAAAQDDAYRPEIRAQIDWAVAEPGGVVTLAGWAFNCATQGQQPFSVRAYYQSQTDVNVGGWATLVVRTNGIKRRDVAAAFTDCGVLNSYTGFHVTFAGIPPGQYRIYLEWADSRSAHYSSVLVDIP